MVLELHSGALYFMGLATNYNLVQAVLFFFHFCKHVRTSGNQNIYLICFVCNTCTQNTHAYIHTRMLSQTLSQNNIDALAGAQGGHALRSLIYPSRGFCCEPSPFFFITRAAVGPGSNWEDHRLACLTGNSVTLSQDP